MAEFKEVNGAELQQLVDSSAKVLVDFYLTNCGPCSMQKMIMKDVAKTMEDVQVVALNMTENEGIMQQYEISTVPYLIVFDKGEEVTRMMGLQQKSVVLAALEG